MAQKHCVSGRKAEFEWMLTERTGVKVGDPAFVRWISYTKTSTVG